MSYLVLSVFDTPLSLVRPCRNKAVSELKVDWALFVDARCSMVLQETTRSL